MVSPVAAQVCHCREDPVLYQETPLQARLPSPFGCSLAEARAGSPSASLIQLLTEFLVPGAAAPAAYPGRPREAPAALETSFLAEPRRQAPIFRPRPTHCHDET